MDIVDIHSHFFSRPFFDTLSGGDDAKLEAVASQTGIELPPHDVASHLARWMADLDAKGVDHLLTFASLPEEVPAVKEAVGLAGGRLSACALVNPKAPPTVQAALDPAFCGVLLFPAMHHFHVGEADDLLGTLEARGALAFVHCGLLVVKLRDLLGLPRPYDLSYANPLDVIPAANRHPNVRFVIPHFGAGFFRETLMVGTQCENVYVDTSSTNSWIRTQSRGTTLGDVFARALDVFGPERILFGTDSSVFPAGWRKERLDEQRAILDDLGLPRVEQEKIFAGNARAILP